MFADLDAGSTWARFLGTVENAICFNTSRRLEVVNILRPWIDGCLLRGIRRKKTLWRLFLRSRNSSDYRTRSFSNVSDHWMKQAKRNYETKVGLGNNKKKLFKYIREHPSTPGCPCHL